MTYKNNRENLFDVKNVFDVIIKRRKILLIICLLAIIISSIVSFIIPARYKATHILFPASSSSISQSLVAESHGKKDLFRFGEEEDVEQLLQVLKSTEIRDRIIEKYDLFNHYDINPNSRYPITTLHRKFKKNIDIRRTEFMSIQIEVLDECPVTAANIANDISAYADSTIRRMRRRRVESAYQMVKNEFENQKHRITEIEDSLKSLGRLGILDVRSQAEVYSDQYAAALANNNIRGAQQIHERLQVLEQHGSSFLVLRERLLEEVKRLAQIETKYVEAKIDLEEDLPNIYVVNYAEVAERKSYPIRWLIVALSTLSTFLFASLVLMFFERLKKK